MNIDRADLGYLAGMIDGEGMIGIYRQPHGTMTRISISNTNPIIIKRVSGILESLGVKHGVYLVNKSKGNRKDMWDVIASSQKSCRQILEAVMPYIHGKKSQAQLLLDYVISRDGKKAWKGLTPEEAAMFSTSRTLNKRGRL